MPSRGQRTSTTHRVRTRARGKCFGWSRVGGGLLALALSLGSATSAAALLCSTANPTVVPGGSVVNSIASDAIKQHSQFHRDAAFPDREHLLHPDQLAALHRGADVRLRSQSAPIQCGGLLPAAARATARPDP